MSISPRVVVKDKDKFVKLHMHLENSSQDEIYGRIVFVIIDPKKRKTKIQEKILLECLSKIDKYYNYEIKNNVLLGRYIVDGNFYFSEGKVRSETYKTDFFDVVN